MDRIAVLNTGVFGVNTYIVPFFENQALVVDPAACRMSGDSNVILDFLEKKGLQCAAILLTHCHFDHITGIAYLKAKFPEAKVLIHHSEEDELKNPPGLINKSLISFFNIEALESELEIQPAADITLANNDSLKLVSEHLENWKVIHTPGHSPGSICVYNEKEKILLAGDTIFADGGYGRTDMAGGNESDIQNSIKKVYSIIKKGTLVCPGHGSTFIYN